jgi:hypothetical protein
MPALYCPTCAAPLATAHCADPRTTCLSCQNGHRYFVPPSPAPASQTTSAAKAKLPALAGRPPAAIAAFWLSDSYARSMLNEQLAELLRTVIDARTAEAESPWSYCPMCAQPLSAHEQPDAWVRGLHCSHGHAWALRGGRLAGGDTPAQVDLHAELIKSTMLQLIQGWLNHNPYLDPQLHESVAGVLQWWRDGVA